MAKEFKSFFKTVGGNEGGKCHYPTRLDTYGCGCAHDCSYCYAKSLLEFRKMWNPQDPAVANIDKIKRKLDKVPSGTVLRLGGMTDCFQPIERKHRITLQTINALNERDIGYLIVTKSAIVAEKEYLDAMRADLAHIQVTVTTLDDDFYLDKAYEKASLPSARIDAIKTLQRNGFDVAIRLSPLIEEYMDFNELNSLGIDKAVVEFLRVNHWIKKWFDIDYSRFTHKENGYEHLELEDKIRILDKIKIPTKTVCEDVTEHYKYWEDNVNPNKNDCCNLRL